MTSLGFVAGLSPSQSLIVGAAQVAQSSTTNITCFRTSAGRFQVAYDSSLFTGAGATGPITIERLRFRKADGRPQLGGQTYANVTVQVGTCAVDHAALGATFANNLGTMGPSGLTTLTVGPAAGTIPNDYVIDIGLASIGASFVYDPTTGADLLIDIGMATDPQCPVPGDQGSGTAGAGSTAVLTQSPGHTIQPITSGNPSRIRYTSGANAGLARSCTSINAGSLAHALFPAAPAAGDTFVVEHLELDAFMAASNSTSHLARSVTTSAPGAATGSVVTTAPVCRIDWTGPGGHAAIIAARVTSVGAGCNHEAVSAYQLFEYSEPFDLAGKSLRFTPDNPAAPTTYSVTSGTVAPDLSAAAIQGTPNIGDTTLSPSLPLGFAFVYAGGSTTAVKAATDGFIWLDAAMTSADSSPDTQQLLGSGTLRARLCPCWHNMHAGRNTSSHPGSGLYSVVDTSGGPGNGIAYFTWKEVGESVMAAFPQGLSVNTFQCVLYENGTFEYRYGSMSGVKTGPTIVGWSPGMIGTTMSIDPYSRDLSHEVPFTTTVEGNVSSMQLLSGGPVLGTSISFSAYPPPFATNLGAMLISFASQQPGVIVPELGPHCLISLDLNLAFTHQVVAAAQLPGVVHLLPLDLPPPAAAGWMGAVLFAQYAGLHIATNRVITSNTLRLQLGLQ